MKRDTFLKAKEINSNIEKIEKLLKEVEDNTFDGICFSLSFEAYVGGICLPLPFDMGKDILDLCKKYKEMYEKQLEEL